MKKCLLSLCIASSLTAVAQSIPNGGFESWTTTTYGNPTYLFTSNGQSPKGSNQPGPVNVLKVSDFFHGLYAIQLNTMLSGSDTAAAYAANGDPSNPAGQGIPYSEKPDGMRFYYKCDVQPGDTAIVVAMFKLNGSIIGMAAKKLTGTQNSYALATVNISLPLTPDSMIFAAVSSNLFQSNFKGIPGSMLQLDSVSFTGVASQPAMWDGDFELWQSQSTDILNNWDISGQQNGGTNKTTDAHNGTYALELITHTSNGGGANTQNATTGHSVQNGTVGGHPYSLQIDTLDFYYKYSPADANDSAQILLQFKNSGTVLTGIGQLLPKALVYTKVTIPFNLTSAPDSLIVFINSSKVNNAPGSYAGADLKIDDISLRSQLAPVADFSLPALVCSGQPAAFTDNSSNIPTSYTWTNTGGAGTFNTSTANMTFTTSGTYSVTLDVSNAYGTSSVTKTITVNQGATVAPSSPDGPVCQGFSNLLFANNSAGSSVVWMPGNITASTWTATPSVTTTYSVVASYTTGCTSPTGTITVTILPQPTVTVNSATICAGNTATLTASGASTYAWIGGPNTSTMIVMPNNTATFTVTGTDANNCSSDAMATVTVNPLPTVCLGNNNPVCENQVINLSYCGSAVVTYAWSGPNAFSSSVSSPTLTATMNAAGSYSLSVTDANNCSNSGSTNVSINPLPTPTLSTNGPVCSGQTLNLSASGGVSYNWTGPNAFASTQQNPSVTNAQVSASGVYTVTVTDLNGCIASDTISGIVNGCLAINNYAPGASVCPNPSSGVFVISVSEGNAAVAVFDLTGKKIASFVLNGTAGEIDLRSFNDGIYFLDIRTSQGITRKKITKSN
jgi:PKD repeat protein